MYTSNKKNENNGWNTCNSHSDPSLSVRIMIGVGSCSTTSSTNMYNKNTTVIKTAIKTQRALHGENTPLQTMGWCPFTATANGE